MDVKEGPVGELTKKQREWVIKQDRKMIDEFFEFMCKLQKKYDYSNEDMRSFLEDAAESYMGD